MTLLKAVFFLVVAFAACLLAPLSALAHAPEGTVFPLYQFSDDRVPEMDGDPSDWEAVPAEYFFDLRHHTEVKEGKGIDHNTADLHIKRAAVGWNDNLNRLYFMVEVADDIHLFSKPADHLDSLDTFNSRRTGAFVHGSDIFEVEIGRAHV